MSGASSPVQAASERPRVLVMCAAFPPANHVSAMRGVRIGNAFLKRGWEVHVLKSAFGWASQDLLVDTSAFRVHSYHPSRFKRIISEAPVKRSPKSLLLALARRLIPPDHSWLMRGAIEQKIDELGGLGQFDCVVSTAFPFVLHDICRQRKERGERFFWVADTRDMWAGSPYRRPQLVPTALLRRVEAKVFATCDVASFASEATARIYEGRYHREMMVVLNGVESVPQTPPHVPAASRWTRLAHTGSLYGGRKHLGPLLAALGQMARAEQREFGLVLAGPDSQMVAAKLPATPGVRLRALGLVSRKAAAELQRDSDAVVLVLADTDFDASVIPAKLFEYAFTGKPLVALAREDSDVGRLVERHRLGVASFDPGKIAQFIAAAERGEWRGADKLSELTADAQFGAIVDRVEQAIPRDARAAGR